MIEHRAGSDFPEIGHSQRIKACERTGPAIEPREDFLLLVACKGQAGDPLSGFEHLQRNLRRILRDSHQSTGHQAEACG